MKRRQAIALFLVGLLSPFLGIACTSLPSAMMETGSISKPTVTVSAAASLQDALEAIAPLFSEAYPDIAIEYNFGSSGALQQQIEQGAPVDIFFPAATDQMDRLAAKNLIDSASRQYVLTNSLALIAPINSQIAITDMAQLSSAQINRSINRLAVGEFRSVPAGQYAQQALKALNLLEPLQPKYVFGSNVRSVLTAVESGNAELGIVYATDAALSNRVTVLTTVPQESHLPIVYPIAITENTTVPEAAQAFINFLMSEQAQLVFVDFGFGRM